MLELFFFIFVNLRLFFLLVIAEHGAMYDGKNVTFSFYFSFYKIIENKIIANMFSGFILFFVF